MARSFPNVYVGSDHQLVLANVKLRPKVKNKHISHNKFESRNSKDADTREIYKIKISCRFEPLPTIPDTDLEVKDMWEKIKGSFKERNITRSTRL